MIVAVVLAAGAGIRFRSPVDASPAVEVGHKLRAAVGDAALLSRSITAALESEIGPVVVVTGADSFDDLIPESVTAITNHAWASGLASSIRAGLGHAAELHADAVVVGLGDQPGVPMTAWRQVAEAAQGPIVIAEFQGRRRPPVRLDGEVWPLLPSSGDDGARILMRDRPELVHSVACDGNPDDIDTLEDLDQWN
jgi:molybdenum cofactor cytidylyltransferase